MTNISQTTCSKTFSLYYFRFKFGRCFFLIVQLTISNTGTGNGLVPTRRQAIIWTNRKYKDYVYRKMLVQEYLKKWRIFKRVKPKNDMMYHDIYNCICQNTKKIRFIIHYVKPTAQLLFRIRFPKGGPTCRRQVVNPRHQTSQGQSVAKPETPLQNIQVE